MAPRSSPTVWRRWLAHELRRLRDRRGFSQKDVGKACGWSGVRVSYLENGQQNVADDDLDLLLPLYDVPPDDRPPYYEAAKLGREKGWWERHDPAVPDYFVPYIGLEQGASRIFAVEPTIVPGLLQTPEYIKATVGADGVPRTRQHADRVAEVRIARQEGVFGGDNPARFSVVMDEAVLHRVADGPATMAAQMDHIVEMSERPNITVRVYPFARGIDQGLVSAARKLEFFPGAPPVVYVELPGRAQYLETDEELSAHELAFERLIESALTPGDTRVLVARMAATYRAMT